MILKRPLISDTWEDLALDIHFLGFPGDRALSGCSSFIQKLVLKRAFSLETELSVNTVVLLRRWSWKGHLLVTLGKLLYAYCSGLTGDRTSSWYISFMWKMILKRIFISDPGGRPCPAHSLFRSSGRKNSSIWCIFSWEMSLKWQGTQWWHCRETLNSWWCGLLGQSAYNLVVVQLLEVLNR